MGFSGIISTASQTPKGCVLVYLETEREAIFHICLPPPSYLVTNTTCKIQQAHHVSPVVQLFLLCGEWVEKCRSSPLLLCAHSRDQAE